MGNCKSTNKNAAANNNTTSSRDSKEQPTTKNDTTTTTTNHNHSTAEFCRSILIIIKPVLRKVISKKLIEKVGVLKDEEKVTKFDPNQELPILPIEMDFQNIQLVSPKELSKDMESMPDFEWPMKESAVSLINKLNEYKQEGQEGLLCFDVDQFKATLAFERGYEITVPVKGPFGKPGQLEIGTDPEYPQAHVSIHVPKLRIWFVTHTQTLYIAFLGRPDIIPHLHVNADFGSGDFAKGTITEDGTLDDIVEQILSGFGPKEYTAKQHQGANNNNNNKTRVSISNLSSTVGTTLGDLIVSAMGTFGRQVGNGRPIEVVLEKKLQASLDAALNSSKAHRPVEAIKADIERLEKELQAAKEHEGKEEEKKQDERLEKELQATKEHEDIEEKKKQDEPIDRAVVDKEEEKKQDEPNEEAVVEELPSTGMFCSGGMWSAL